MSSKIEDSNKKERRRRKIKSESNEKEHAGEFKQIIDPEAGSPEELIGTKRNRNSLKDKESQPRKRSKDTVEVMEMLPVKVREGTQILEDKVSTSALQIQENKEEETVQAKSLFEENKPIIDNSGSEVVNDKKLKTTRPKRESQKRRKNENDEPILRPVKYESLGEGPPPVPSTGKIYIGCHVSGAGGIWNAFTNAEECNAKSFALFLRTQRQWAAKPLDDATVNKWKSAMKDVSPHLILPHGSYLMNLGCPATEVLSKSRAMLLEEIGRCERLGIPHFNFHPGSTLGKVTREECCKTIAESINYVAEQTKDVIFVLENMSCQGNTVGGDFHELRTIIENVKDKTRIGVCLDTCHAHAAGYDLGTESGFEKFIEDFGKIVGWQFLRGLHINDSKGEAGSHLDRHENIGKGTIGIEGLSRIVNCKRFEDLPLILETPWESNANYAKEVKLLESLVK